MKMWAKWQKIQLLHIFEESICSAVGTTWQRSINPHWPSRGQFSRRPLCAEGSAERRTMRRKREGGVGLVQATRATHVKHLLKSYCGPGPGPGSQGQAKLIPSLESLPLLPLVPRDAAKEERNVDDQLHSQMLDLISGFLSKLLFFFTPTHLTHLFHHTVTVWCWGNQRLKHIQPWAKCLKCSMLFNTLNNPVE